MINFQFINLTPVTSQEKDFQVAIGTNE